MTRQVPAAGPPAEALRLENPLLLPGPVRVQWTSVPALCHAGSRETR